MKMRSEEEQAEEKVLILIMCFRGFPVTSCVCDSTINIRCFLTLRAKSCVHQFLYDSVSERAFVSAAVLQSVHDLFQNVGASVGDLLQDLVGVLLELRPLPLTQR